MKRLSVIVVLMSLFAPSACDDAGESPEETRPSPSAAPSPSPTPEHPLPKRGFLRTACDMPAEWARYINRGWVPGKHRNNDLVIVPRSGSYMGSFKGTSHSGPYDYLQDVPLTFYGPGFIEPLGRITPDREVTVADIAPTVARLLDFDFPARKARPLEQVLVNTDKTPRLVVTISIDGGGWNVLEHWPDAWPNLRRLMDEGANLDNAVVGSSPSITPAIHTNMSTGAFPRQHGVSAIAVRANNGTIVGGFSAKAGNSGAAAADPTVNLKLTTVGDLWDAANGNRPLVGMVAAGNYPLGLLGHGSALDGGDKDILALQAGNEWATNPTYYSMPDYLNTEVPGPAEDIERLDRADGKDDDRWRGHEIAPLDATPAFASWQERSMRSLLEREGFGADRLTDLFYIQYKSPDAAGHKWNMIAPEQADVLRSVDDALGALVEWLDENVGRQRYVVIVTADHGQQPLEAGGWPIDRNEIVADIDARFDRNGNERGIIQRTSATSFFVNADELRDNDVSIGQVASFLSGYRIKDNVPDGELVPNGYRSRSRTLIFAAVFAGKHLPKIVACTGAG